MRFVTGRTLTAAALVSGGVFAQASVAFALTPPAALSQTAVTVLPLATSADCPRGWVCLFEDADYTGRMLKFRDVGTQDLRNWRGGFRDKTSSVWNRTLRTVVLLNQRTRLRDERYPIAPGGFYSHLGKWNDKTDKITIN